MWNVIITLTLKIGKEHILNIYCLSLLIGYKFWKPNLPFLLSCYLQYNIFFPKKFRCYRISFYFRSFFQCRKIFQSPSEDSSVNYCILILITCLNVQKIFSILFKHNKVRKRLLKLVK
jgi:hypothetical protein